jgi:hypothetical protein
MCAALADRRQNTTAKSLIRYTETMLLLEWLLDDGEWVERLGKYCSDPDLLTAHLIEPIRMAVEGDASADKELRGLAEFFIRKGKPLPKPLADYACDVLGGNGPRLKRGAYKTEDRDRRIARTIRVLREIGFRPSKARELVLSALKRMQQSMNDDAFKKAEQRGRALLVDG